jgi:hexosaminidase
MIFILLLLLQGLHATQASNHVWPLPSKSTSTENAPTRPLSTSFTIDAVGKSSSALKAATTRYLNLLQPNSRSKQAASAASPLPALHVNITGTAVPYVFGDDESYSLHWTKDASAAQLISNTLVGALRGLETFAQLVEPDPVYRSIPLEIPDLLFALEDAPRYPYRGLMMDLSRHYYPVAFIEKQIDVMAQNKLNVLHLHLTDDQSFPLESTTHPELAASGAFTRPTSSGRASYVYTQSDLSSLGSYAALRGVVLLPEIDMPAHSSSWGASHPELMVTGGTGCSPSLFQHGDTLNPIENGTYQLVDDLMTELANNMFPTSPFLHLGGDEVPTACWAGNKSITDWMVEHGMASGDYDQLESYFVNRVAQGAGLQSTNRTLVYWEEIFNNNVKLDKDVIIQAWKSDAMSGIIRAGHRTTNSFKWYLNHGCDNYGDGLWDDFYVNDPMLWVRNFSR